MSEKTRRVFDWILEILWLTAVVKITLFFNIYTKDSRIFEPQKALILRTLVMMMLAVWVIRVLEENRERLQAAKWWWGVLIGIVVASGVLALGLFVLAAVTWPGGPLDGMLQYVGVDRMAPIVRTPFPVVGGILEIPVNFVVLVGVGLALFAAVQALRTSWKEALRTAMVIPALAYIAVHIVSTVGSVFPLASLYGGYVRQQGTLSVLAYIGLAFILATTLRRREQLERLITVILLTSLPAALYGVVQMLGVDPLPWMGNVEARVASTMGNAIFIAAYLIMVLPLTGYRLLSTWKQIQASPPPEEGPAGRPSLRWYRPAIISFSVVIGLLAVILLLGLPVYNAARRAYLEQQGLSTIEVMTWSQWGVGLLITLGTLALTVGLPAFFYLLLRLVRDGRRLFLALGGGVAFLLALGLRLLLPVLFPDLNGDPTWNTVSWALLLTLLLAWILLAIWPERWRPYIHLVAVAMAFVVVVAIMLASIHMFSIPTDFAAGLDRAVISTTLRKEFQVNDRALSSLAKVEVSRAGSDWIIVDDSTRSEYFIHRENQALNVYIMTRDNGFAWSGYLIGLCILALLSAWLHYRHPWGRDALWTDAVYVLLVGQAMLFYVLIVLYLPSQPYPSLNTLAYPMAMILFLASCFVVLARRAVGRVGYIAQLMGYIVLAALQVLCIFLTQSRGPMLGLVAGLAVFVLLALLLVARNARRGEEGRPLPRENIAPTAVAAVLAAPLLVPLFVVSGSVALLAALGNGRRSFKQQMATFLRTFSMSAMDVLRSWGFFFLLLLNLLAGLMMVGLLAALLSGRPLSLLGQEAISWWVWLLGWLLLLAASSIATALVLFGPGLPRSGEKWIASVVVNLVPVVGLFVAMVMVRRGRRWLWYSMLILVSFAALILAVYNVPDTPVLGDLVMSNPQTASIVEHTIKPLKALPYVGRLGKLFAASETTGRVRVLIWFGDEIGTGAVGMIEHHPLRTLIGYGPDAMHVAYNPYYPPELAHVEKRNASPDRSHNAIFDELVTLGVAGLAAYLFYFIAFFVLVWQLLWRAPHADWQALAVGLLSLGVAHFVETFTGIPIVSTRMYMWLAIGVAVALTFMPPFRPEEPAAAEVEENAGPHQAQRRRRRGERFRQRRGVPALWVLAYIIIGLATSVLAYRANLKPMVADVLYWQSKQLEAQAAAYQKELSKITDQQQKDAVETLIQKYTRESLDSLQRAIYLMPEEDFYYLSLAQVYLSGTGQAGAGVDEMFRSTERAITRARELSPLNTDHYRNMAALHLAWFGSPSSPRNASSLPRAIQYSEQALSLTANNADLHNRLAQAYIMAANSTAAVQQSVLPLAQQWLQDWPQRHLTSGGRAGDTHLPLVAQYRAEAGRLLQEGSLQRGFWVLAAAELQYSLFLDEQYASTYLTLGDLYRTLDMPAEAALTYERGVGLKRDLLSDAQFEGRLKWLSGAGQLEPLFRAFRGVADQAERILAGLGAGTPPATLDRWHLQAGDAYQALAYMSILRGNNQEAISYYEQALSHRETFEAHKNLTILYDRVGQYEQSLAAGQTALRIAQEKNDTTNVEALQGFLEQVQAKLDQLRQAQERVQANPTDYQAHYALATLYRQGNRLPEAIAEAQLAAQYVPRAQPEEVAKVYNLLGQCAFQAKENDQAEQAFLEVLKVAREDFTALYGLAQVYKAQGRIAEARAQAQAALAVAAEGQRAEVQTFLDGLGKE